MFISSSGNFAKRLLRKGRERSQDWLMELPSVCTSGAAGIRMTRHLADLVGLLTQPGQPGVTVEEMRLPE